MNFFKNWPSWLKGGSVGAIIGLLSYLLNLISCTYCSMCGCVFPIYCGLIKNIVFNFRVDFNGLPSVFANYYLSWASFGATIISYFLVGVLVGWIVGKIKNK